jgi:hypothetical protein
MKLCSRFVAAVIALAASSIGFAASSAIAGGTRFLSTQTPDDFAAGSHKGTILSGSGELRLGRSLASLGEISIKSTGILSLVRGPDGTIYAGTAGDGKVLAIKDGKVTTLWESDEPVVSAVALDSQNRLLIGVSGEHGQLVRLPLTPDAKPEVLLKADGLQYIWGLARVGNVTYVATGPEGKLYSVPDTAVAGAEPVVALDTEESNLVSIAADDKGRLVLGTDPEGLLLRFDPGTKAMEVLYDADEPEISSLAIDGKGNIYAATGTPVEGDGDAGGHNPGGGMPDSPMGMLRLDPGVRLVSVGPATEPADASSGPDVPEGGNAVYRITPDGLVSEVLRAPVTIYDLLLDDTRLILATGGQGRVYQYDLLADELTELARVQGKMATTLLKSDAGIVVAGASVGSVDLLSTKPVAKGVYISKVLDASRPAMFGTAQFAHSAPTGTSITLSTRTGNLPSPGDGEATPTGWTAWSAETPLAQFVPLAAPAGRYVQYRLTLSTTGESVPGVKSVELSYRLPNGAPKVESLTSEPAEDVKGGLKLSWSAEDPDEDDLRFDLYFRPVGAGDEAWRPLASKVAEASFVWNTLELSDGKYQLRVVASDSASNDPGEGKSAGRVSVPVLVDNTAPVLSNLAVHATPTGTVVKLTATDAAGFISSVQYRVGAGDSVEWMPAKSVDKLFDSPTEAAEAHVGVLVPGRHVVYVKATDSRGNEGYAHVVIDVPAAAR